MVLAEMCIKEFTFWREHHKIDYPCPNVIIVIIMTSDLESENSIIFKNNCKTLPIIVSSWMYKLPGLSEYIDVEIPPNTMMKLQSSTGEWIIGSLFQEKKHRDLWKSHHLDLDPRIAKFRKCPCACGDCVWNFMENEFDLAFDKNDENENERVGMVTWSRPNDSLIKF